MKNKAINKIYSVIAVIAITLIGSSCSNFFEEQAGNRIEPGNHYKSLIDLTEVSMPGVLTPLKEAMPKLILIDGLLSDQLMVTENADGYMRDINEHIFSIDNPYLNTSDFYKLIINANEVLQNLYKIAEIDPDFDEFYVSSYENYLIGMRSWAYFTLVKLNGEAAWIEDNMTELPENGLSYIPKDAMLDTLINQLLPNLHTDLNLDEIYIPLYVNTKVLIGEIYLEKNDYSNAVTYLKMGLESYGDDKKMFKLEKTFQKESWFTIFLNAENNTIENISVIPFKSTEGQVNPVTQWTLYNDQYVVKPSQRMMNLFMNQYPVKGAKGDTYRGIGFSVDTVATGEAYVKKYGLDVGEPYGADIIISRAADIHLLLAEAYNRMGDSTTALIFLNTGWSRAAKIPTEYRRWNGNLGVRGRLNLMPRTVPSDITDPTKIMEYIEDAIIEERSLELAFEGHRYFDLMRIARRRNDKNYLASRVASKFTDEAQRKKIQEYLWNENTWYIPLNK
ncbi:MAG: RagB/SusD family nutrient uptake outer membrane protein [Prolixibacteraceae bacterium]